jgi:phosphopantothenate-cysteine ligase
MNILITAGGTRENIDSVRSISNHSTGRLGSVIADTYAQSKTAVTFLCGETSVLPFDANAEIIRIKDTEELMGKMDSLLHNRIYDCVIHSLAVSDYTPHAVLTPDEMIERIIRMLREPDISERKMAEKILAAIMKNNKIVSGQKINSNYSDLALILKRTPKVINRIKSIQPDTLLVGFKLLDAVPRDTLIDAGHRMLLENQCSLVMANDLSEIYGETHIGYLIDSDKNYKRYTTKNEIAKAIVNTVYKMLRSRL